jgi:hypothetical protein
MTLFKSPTRYRVELKIIELETANDRLRFDQSKEKVTTNPVRFFKIDTEIFHNKIRIEVLKSVL